MDLTLVSRETLDRLRIYEALTKKWTQRINLVSPSSTDAIWSRHIEDSAQVFYYMPAGPLHVVDFGSGAGFPALVVSILGAEIGGDLKVTCIESDSRKCVFLRTVAPETGIEVNVINDRVEKVAPQHGDVVTARAFTSLVGLLEVSQKHRKPEGVCLFPKGKSFEKELAAAREIWDFHCKTHQSQTDSDAVILEIGAFARV